MSSPQIPDAIKRMMKDCILSLFWPHRDIIKFFRTHRVLKTEALPLQHYLDLETSRAGTVDAIFEKLDEREDGGLEVYWTILRGLANWTDFDRLWFDVNPKLDRQVANANIARLRVHTAAFLDGLK